MPNVDGFTCYTYSCSGDDDWAQAERAEKGLGDAGPLGAGLRDDVNCGARIKDVMLGSCVGPAECAAEAAGACEATPGCASFAISSALDNYQFAMLFGAARGTAAERAVEHVGPQDRDGARAGAAVEPRGATPAPAPAPGRPRAARRRGRLNLPRVLFDVSARAVDDRAGQHDLADKRFVPRARLALARTLFARSH